MDGRETKLKLFIHEYISFAFQFVNFQKKFLSFLEIDPFHPLFPIISIFLHSKSCDEFLQKRSHRNSNLFSFKRKSKSFEPLCQPFHDTLQDIISWQIVRLISLRVSSSIIDWWTRNRTKFLLFFLEKKKEKEKRKTKSWWSTRAVDNYCLHVRSHVSDSQRDMLHVHAHVSYANADGG